MTPALLSTSPGIFASSLPLRRHAFSLVEVVVAIIIVSTMLATSMYAVGAAARDRRVQADIRRGHELCRALMTEVLQQRFEAPPGSATPSTTTRANWDTVDDYDALTERPPLSKSGVALSGASGWTRTVSVSYATFDTTSYVAAKTASQTTLKRIVITATSPRGFTSQLIAYRSAFGVPDRTTPNAGITTWQGFTAQIGPDLTTITAGAELLNQPSP